MMKRITALLLCFAMLAALCGCTGGGAETTAPPTVPTTVPPTAAEVYAEAAGKLAGLESAELVITYEENMTLGEDHFQTTSKETVTLLGLGTDTFAASSKENFFSGDLTVTVKEVFQNGTVYTQLNSDSYKSELSAEDYLADLLPMMLVDAALYGSIEQDEAGVFHFTDATALEEWCDNPYAIFESAAATAELSVDGLPCKYTYSAVYTQGAADAELNVTMEIKAPTATEIALPGDADKYQSTEQDENGMTMADVVAQIYLIKGYLDQTSALTCTRSDLTICQAGAFADSTVYTTSVYDRGEDVMVSFQTDNQTFDYSTGKDLSSSIVETFRDGVLTTVIDDGEPETVPGITKRVIESYVDDELLYLFPELGEITGYTLSIIGDAALLEYTFSDAYADYVESYNCQYYFDDSTLLRDLASEHAVTENSGYMGIDLTTGLPLSMGQSFAATHTIDGQEYLFSVENQMALQLGSRDSYETITGEPLPEKEPEELPKPVFYKVTGQSGETMWLLGTIHVGDERTSHLPQEIYDAFAAADALAVEFDSESYNNSLMEDEEAIEAYRNAMFYMDGTTLKDHLEDETLYENTIKLMKATGNYANAQMVDMTRPVFHEMILQNYYLANGYRLSGDHGVDSLLEELAREQEKEILSVESGEFQMDLLSELSDPLQELLLKEAVEYGQFYVNYSTQELFEMWCRGDEAELIEYLNEEEDDSDLTEEEKLLYEEYENALGGMRNEDMLTVAQEYLGSGKTVFYAVGLAHLLAEDGLVNTLRNAGYTVELVTYAE